MRYRSRPKEIEAWQVQPDMGTCPVWFTDALGKTVRGTGGWSTWFIKTLEGEMRVDAGDFVIRGIEGELYPCKATIFEKTYERITD